MRIFQSIEFVHLNLGSNGCLTDKWNTHVQYSSLSALQESQDCC